MHTALYDASDDLIGTVPIHLLDGDADVPALLATLSAQIGIEVGRLASVTPQTNRVPLGPV